LQIDGKIGLDRKLEMEGDLVLMRMPPINSFVAANRDQQGTIQIPLRIVGDLSQPRFLIIDDSLSQMVQKASEFERSR
jgi:hypothetical protein